MARVYLLCLLLYALSFGSVVPTWPFVLRTLFLDPSTAAYFFGLIEASHSLAEFLCSPLLGRFSDRFGRRPLLLLSVSSKCVDLLLCLMALHFHSLALYWCGRFISGVVASFLSTVTAAVVDCSPAAVRSQNIALIGVAFGMGFVIGPVSGGVMSQLFGLEVPYLVALAMMLCNYLFMVCVCVRESNQSAGHGGGANSPTTWRDSMCCEAMHSSLG